MNDFNDLPQILDINSNDSAVTTDLYRVFKRILDKYPEIQEKVKALKADRPQLPEIIRETSLADLDDAK